ncbi:MAG: anaerobic ribonucleoside-triphosphate reductase activating protein, partial [Nanoarchaeota archaeon]|nr:anaerobic ribonucleoside-triphosphate reductase activating protein [Nanoarchaeota archaeon]
MGLSIKGLQKTTLVDYPGKVACTVFLPNCNFRCGFCHNKDLVLNSEVLPAFSEQDVLEYLKEKKRWLDGICITGGEPLLHKELINFLPKVKEIGYLVKIDTNGTNPTFLKELIDRNLIDFIAMDIKNSIEKYEETAGAKVDTEDIKKSIDLIKNSGIDYEFRTTVVPCLHTKEDMMKIGELLKESKKFAIQNFKPANEVIDPKYKEMKGFTKEELE